MKTLTHDAPHTRTPLKSLETGNYIFDKYQTTADRILAMALIRAAGATACYRPELGSYVGFTNAEGAVVAYIHATYITILDNAASTPERDLKTGRPMKSTAHDHQGWDIYLSGWGGRAKKKY